MNWSEPIRAAYEARPPRAGIAAAPRFHPGASAARLDEAEARLGVRLPASLRSLLAESDGLMETLSLDGGEPFESLWLVWPLEEIVRENLRRSTSPEPTSRRDPRSLLLFATAGCDGILFGFPVSEAGTCASNVTAWYPIGSRLKDLAPSLEAFLTGWMAGAISV